MRLSTLTYPVEQPYRLRYITEIFYATSTVLIALLVLLNVILAGYEETTVVQSDPNVDPECWWAPKSLPPALRFRTRPRECEATTLPLDIPLRTNSSLPFFSYYHLRDLSQYLSGAENNSNTEPAYRADPMGNCTVGNMKLLMNTNLMAFTIDTSLLCNLVGDKNYTRRFKTSFQRSPNSVLHSDSILDFLILTESLAPNGSGKALSSQEFSSGSYLYALGVVDALAADLLHMMWMRQVTYQNTKPTLIPELVYLVWYAQKDSLSPTDSSRMEKPLWDFVSTINTTIVNVLLSVRDMIHLDVGSVTPTNIYKDKASFDRLIQVDPYFSTLSSEIWRLGRGRDDNQHLAGTRAWGSPTNVNVSWAEALTTSAEPVNNISLPIHIPEPRYPTVINIAYACSQYQMKSWGNLLASVFAGTFSMYLVVYGIFVWLAPGFDRKHHGPQPWEQYKDQCLCRSTHEAHSSSSTPQSISSDYTLLHHISETEVNKELSGSGNKAADVNSLV